MSYTKRFYGEVEERLQDKHGYDGKISADAIAAEAERIGNTPSEFYPIMARVRPEAALDGIRKAHETGDFRTIELTSCALLTELRRGHGCIGSDVSVDHLESLLAMALEYGESGVQRAGDEADAEAARLQWRKLHGTDHPCATCRRGMASRFSDGPCTPATEVLEDIKANFATMMPAEVG